MKSDLYKYLLIIFLQISNTVICSAQEYAKSAVTYEFSGGRLGDDILAYLHAKWISYKYQIPLLYKPFPYSDRFLLDSKEKKIDTYNLAQYRRVVYLGREKTVDLQVNIPTLYIVPYFPESDCERRYFLDPRHQPYPYFAVDWKDPNFRKCVLEMLRPISKLDLCNIQKDKVTVAIHVRTGGGYIYDRGLEKVIPHKFPSEAYYLDQLMTICTIFPIEKIQVHIFTDDPNPASLAKRFKEFLQEERVEFTYRESGNSYDKNIIEDLISMMQFDCLIRPESNFSIVASCLIDYKVLIYPDDISIGGNPYINKVKIIGSLEK